MAIFDMKIAISRRLLMAIFAYKLPYVGDYLMVLNTTYGNSNMPDNYL